MRLSLRSHMPVRGIRVSPKRDPESFKVCPPRPLRVASVAGPSGIPSWLASLPFWSSQPPARCIPSGLPSVAILLAVARRWRGSGSFRTDALGPSGIPSESERQKLQEKLAGKRDANTPG